MNERRSTKRASSNDKRFADDFTLAGGFTLVELLVSLAIASTIMLGMAVFFSGTFQNMFTAQQRVDAIQGQFVVNQIASDKFSGMEKIITDLSASPDHVVFQSQSDTGNPPFTYIGKRPVTVDGVSTDHLVMKDFMVFNKVDKDGNYGDSGTGKIMNVTGGPELADVGDKNFGGFAEKPAGTFYVADTQKNKILKCTPACSDYLTTGFSHPTDIAAGSANLYISDSGNDRIRVVNLSDASVSDLPVTGLNFPTGLSYYKKNASENFLFIADTLNNEVKRVDIGNTDPLTNTTTIAGAGSNETCAGTASLCKLRLPTGIYADKTTLSLYIADTGNDRILKVSDPPTSPLDLDFQVTLGGNAALSKIEFVNAGLSGGSYDTGVGNLPADTPAHYDAGLKTFAYAYSGADKLNIFSNGTCASTGNTLYLKQNPAGFPLVIGDKIVLGAVATTYTIAALPGVIDCDPGAPILNEYKIEISESIASVIPDDTSVYFANPDPIIVRLTGATVPSGFQLFTINTYAVAMPSPGVSYKTLPVGDGEIGTAEDQVQVLVSAGLNFPTGVALKDVPGEKVFIANTLTKKIQLWDTALGTLSPGLSFNALSDASADFANPDFTSDFALSNSDPTKELSFSKLTSGASNVLEMTLTPMVSDSDAKTYTIDAKLPTP